MTKLLGLLVAATGLVLGLAQSAEAQGLPAGAVALAAGNYLTIDDTTITIGSGLQCNDDGITTCANYYLAPGSGPGASVIIEAAEGSAAGSTLEPIFSYSCPSSGVCDTSGTYDITVYLTVQENTSQGTFTAISGSLAGSDSSSSLNADVQLGETGTDNNFDPLCSTNVNLTSPSFACNYGSSYGAQQTLYVEKDFGFTLNGISNGSTLALNSVTQNFTPAPEPASLATLLGGVIALAAARRGRRRAG